MQVQAATKSLSERQISTLLGYDYVGNFAQTTSTGTTISPTTDRKLWLIGAILGPIAFVVLLIFVCCYLHYKCRPRPNPAVTKVY
jgi:hypothetical protein